MTEYDMTRYCTSSFKDARRKTRKPPKRFKMCTKYKYHISVIKFIRECEALRKKYEYKEA